MKIWEAFTKPNFDRPCQGKICWRDIDCFTWIVDKSYEIEEVISLKKIVKAAMLDD